MNVNKQYEQLSDQEVTTAITALCLDGSMDEFRGCDLDTDTFERWCVRGLIVKEARPAHIEPTLFKVGGVPEEKKKKKPKKYKFAGLSAQERERLQSLERAAFQKKINATIKKHVAIEMKKPCEVLQSSEPIEMYYGSDEIHDPDPASQSIIDKAFRDYEGTGHTPWRRQAFMKIFSHEYLTKKQLIEARRLY